MRLIPVKMTLLLTKYEIAPIQFPKECFDWFSIFASRMLIRLLFCSITREKKVVAMLGDKTLVHDE